MSLNLNSHIKTLGFFVITSFIPTLLVLRWQKCALKTNLCISFVLTGLSKKFSDPTLNPSFAIDPELLADADATVIAGIPFHAVPGLDADSDGDIDPEAKKARDAAEADAIKSIRTNPLDPSSLIIRENIANAIRAVRENEITASITAHKGDESPKKMNAKEYLRGIIKKDGALHQIISLYQSDRPQFGQGATQEENKAKAQQMAKILTKFCTRIQKELQ